jgi:hypothetical protein
LIACLSGPERTRANVEVALEDARIPQLPDDHHGMMDWNRKLPQLPSGEEPKEPHGFVTVHVADAEGLNKAVSACEPHSWVLRVHYPEPDRPEPSPEQRIAATLADMQREIAELKARVA